MNVNDILIIENWVLFRPKFFFYVYVNDIFITENWAGR